jgi:16S rRNA (uracil1498-N3)-methyltransferase
MTPPLFLLRDLPLTDVIVLTGDEGRHAARVRRIGVGEIVCVGDGRGAVLTTTVLEVRPDGLVLGVSTRVLSPPPDPRVVVVQALPKGERAEIAVEVLTELGVDEIVPWSAARSIAQWRGEKATKAVEKWQRTADEASKQSRRAFIPSITPLVTTAQVAERIGGMSAAFVLHEDARDALVQVALPADGDIALIVGPEGGISPDELERFSAAGAHPVRLGEPILRTSTAGAAALAALSVRLGRWG